MAVVANCAGALPARVTAQVDSRPSRAPITSGAMTKGVRHRGPHRPLWGSSGAACRVAHTAVSKVVRTVPCAALSQETPLPHSGLCGPLSPTSPAFLRAVTIARVRHSGPHSPLCGSESGVAPSAQRTVRTTYADSRGRPRSLSSVGKVRINARSAPTQRPALNHPAFLLGRRRPSLRILSSA